MNIHNVDYNQGQRHPFLSANVTPRSLRVRRYSAALDSSYLIAMTSNDNEISYIKTS